MDSERKLKVKVRIRKQERTDGARRAKLSIVAGVGDAGRSATAATVVAAAVSDGRVLLPRTTFEGAFSANVQVFHCRLRRVAIRDDGKGDAAQADGVFPFGLVGEGVAIVVLHRERFVSRPNDHSKRAALFAD